MCPKQTLDMCKVIIQNGTFVLSKFAYENQKSKNDYDDISVRDLALFSINEELHNDDYSLFDLK